MDNATKVREFIVENFLFGEEDIDLQNDTSFLEEGIIDSTGILELVSWLEEEFDLEVADDELVPENLDSIAALSVFIDGKKK